MFSPLNPALTFRNTGAVLAIADTWACRPFRNVFHAPCTRVNTYVSSSDEKEKGYVRGFKPGEVERKRIADS